MRRVIVLGVALYSLSVGTAAFAHGDLESARPATGSHVKRVPRAVELTFAEAPTADSRFELLDGCREDALGDVSIEGRDARLEISGGEPGRWRVRYRTVSSVDGHLVRGEYAFHVGGKKDCSAEPRPSPSDEVGEAAPPLRPTGEDSSGSPFLMLIVGGVVLVAAAVVIRILMAR